MYAWSVCDLYDILLQFLFGLVERLFTFLCVFVRLYVYALVSTADGGRDAPGDSGCADQGNCRRPRRYATGTVNAPIREKALVPSFVRFFFPVSRVQGRTVVKYFTI